MRFSTPLTSSGSRALVASSKSMTSGSMARARAMATRCCCPPERSRGRWSARSARPTSARRRRARSRASALGMPLTLHRARATFSRAVWSGKRLKCWKTMPMRARRMSGLTSRALSPARSTSPLLGSCRRLTPRSSVDLPEPEGPMMQVVVPGRDGEADVAEHLDVAVGHGQVLQFQAGAVEGLDVRRGGRGGGAVAGAVAARLMCCSR